MIIKFKISADKVSIKNPEKTNYNSGTFKNLSDLIFTSYTTQKSSVDLLFIFNLKNYNLIY